MSLAEALADLQDLGPDAVFEAFAAWSARRGLPLYPHQEESLMEIVSGANVILGTPTGSGKSLVATGRPFAGTGTGRRRTTPRRSRHWCRRNSSTWCDIFGPAAVGMITGDAA